LGNNRFSNNGSMAMAIKESSWRQARSREKKEGSQCSRSSSQKFKCYYCNEEGNMKRNFSKRKKDLRDEKKSIVGVVEGLHLDDRGVVFLATTENSRKSNRILDSDCSFHMSSIREHFDMCRPHVIRLLK